MELVDESTTHLVDSTHLIDSIENDENGIMNVDPLYRIEDTRTSADFKTLTFSNFKKVDVKKELIDAMLKYDGKLENAQNWCAELICSGNLLQLWETILFFFSRYIHLGNTKIPIYLYHRYSYFKDLTNDVSVDDDLELRNDSRIRDLFSEIICVLTRSKKIYSAEYLKISPEDFDLTKCESKFRAPSLDFAIPVMKKGDPIELSVPLNEFIHHLLTKNNNWARYWADWIIDFDSLCRSKTGNVCFCEPRTNIPVERKFQKDIIWLIWDSIYFLCQCPEYVNTPYISEIVVSLFNLFCIRYTNGCCKKRRCIIYYAISILTESFNYVEVPIIDDVGVIDFYKENINQVYFEIKKNGVTHLERKK